MSDENFYFPILLLYPFASARRQNTIKKRMRKSLSIANLLMGDNLTMKDPLNERVFLR